jgi:hypothetical protein
MELAH